MTDEKDINYAETYRIMEGRKFFNEEDFLWYFPNDGEEIDRANIQHNILRYVWQGNFSSKIKERLIKGNTKVIDLGCGTTGQWLIDMSLKYPLSTFIGIDIAPITHYSQENKPDNVAILKHNLLDGIPFPDETFDFVYQRSVAFKLEDWTYIIDEIIRVTNLNGCVEFMNFDLYKVVPYEGPILNKLHSTFLKLLSSDDFKFATPAELMRYLNRTNRISNIQIEEKSIPLGWDGRLGELMLLDFIMAYKGMKAFLLPLMEITGEEFDNLLNELVNECIRYKPNCCSYRIYGKKI